MYDQPNYMPTAVIHDRRHINWRLTGAYVIGALGVGCAIACLLLLVSFKHAYATQMTQMRHVIGTEQTERSGAIWISASQIASRPQRSAASTCSNAVVNASASVCPGRRWNS
jgi:hypothetical protein